MADLSEPAPFSWWGRDDQRLEGLLTLPRAAGAGPRPVLVLLPGGPGGRAPDRHLARMNHIVEDLGFALIQPQVRGSGGRGRVFEDMDNGRLRSAAVDDLGALLQWIGRQPVLDGQRVFLAGGGYGGYLALGAAAAFSDRVAGVVSISGYVNLLSLIDQADPARRDALRSEFGDERDPAMRSWLTDAAPSARTAQMRAPVLLIHGANDRLVPKGQVDALAGSLRAAGIPVWQMMAAGQSHGFDDESLVEYRFALLSHFLGREAGGANVAAQSPRAATLPGPVSGRVQMLVSLTPAGQVERASVLGAQPRSTLDRVAFAALARTEFGATGARRDLTVALEFTGPEHTAADQP